MFFCSCGDEEVDFPPVRNWIRHSFLVAVLLLASLLAVSRFEPALAKTPRQPGPQPNASGLSGHWAGSWVREGDSLPVWFDFTGSDGEYAGTFGSESFRVSDIPFQGVSVDADSVHWLLVGDETTTRFSGALQGNRLNGTFSDVTGSGTFQMERTSQPAAPPYTKEEVHFKNGDVTLAGTLLMPDGKGRHPAILFVHGSGAEGRYASRFLADRFARAGFAALIYDKRGVGASNGDWKRASLDDLAKDALAGIALLSNDPRVRYDAVGIHGQSQGGTLAPLIASRAPSMAFVIASSAGGVTFQESERYSLRNFVGISKMHGADSLGASRYVDTIVNLAYAGEPWSRADSVARANVGQKWYMGIPDSTDAFWSLAPRIASYDPAAYWRHVRAPVLLVYGEKDERVPVQESIDKIQTALSAGGNKDVTTKVFIGVDHTFRFPPSADGQFHWPRTPPDYLSTLIDWARAKTKS